MSAWLTGFGESFAIRATTFAHIRPRTRCPQRVNDPRSDGVGMPPLHDKRVVRGPRMGLGHRTGPVGDLHHDGRQLPVRVLHIGAPVVECQRGGHLQSALVVVCPGGVALATKLFQPVRLDLILCRLADQHLVRAAVEQFLGHLPRPFGRELRPLVRCKGSITGSHNSRCGVPPSTSSRSTCALPGWIPITAQSRYVCGSMGIVLFSSELESPRPSPHHPLRISDNVVLALRVATAFRESTSAISYNTDSAMRSM